MTGNVQHWSRHTSSSTHTDCQIGTNFCMVISLPLWRLWGSSHQVIPGKWKRLEPGEIYESFLSMKRNEVFKNLRRYSSEIMQALNDIIRGLAS